jgi:hypothetical protein
MDIRRRYGLLVSFRVADLAAEVAYAHSAQRNNRSVDEDDPGEEGGFGVVAK